MNNIKTIVFDLDGTIYQNNDFHRDYIHFLLEGSNLTGWEDSLVRFIDGVYTGKHLTMNAYYSTARISAGTAEEYFAALERAYVPGIDFDCARSRGDLVFLGDAWAVVSLIGKTLGLLENGRDNQVYRKTRQKMSQDGMQGNQRLRRAILALGSRYETVLLTNSYEETALDFLAQLGFSGIFRRAVYSAGKPFDLVKNLSTHFPELRSRPETFLTVGDHAFNDLMPLQQLGCKALWINPFENVHEARADITVHTLDELAECLECMCR